MLQKHNNFNISSLETALVERVHSTPPPGLPWHFGGEIHPVWGLLVQPSKQPLVPRLRLKESLRLNLTGGSEGKEKEKRQQSTSCYLMR